MDRVADSAAADFHSRIEAARAGQIFAHDQRAYSRWQGRRVKPGRGSVGLTGADLERVVMGIAVTHPGLVSVRV